MQLKWPIPLSPTLSMGINNSATFSPDSGVWSFDQHHSQGPKAKNRVYNHCCASVPRYGREETVGERKDKCVNSSFCIKTNCLLFWFETNHIMIQCHIIYQEPLGGVKNLQVSDPTTSSLRVRWEPAEGNVRQYRLFYVPATGGAEDMVRYVDSSLLSLIWC